MDSSNPNLDPELNDPLLDTYHAFEGAFEPTEIEARRLHSKHRKNTFRVDFSN